MINNRKAYKIFMSLPKEKRRKLQIEHEIASIDNYEDQSWQNRFGTWQNGQSGSFWNWLWMCHFKNKRRNMNICSTCNGNHYVRINENTTTFCTDCNGKDEVKESVLKKLLIPSSATQINHG